MNYATTRLACLGMLFIALVLGLCELGSEHESKHVRRGLLKNPWGMKDNAKDQNGATDNEDILKGKNNVTSMSKKERFERAARIGNPDGYIFKTDKKTSGAKKVAIVAASVAVTAATFGIGMLIQGALAGAAATTAGAAATAEASTLITINAMTVAAAMEGTAIAGIGWTALSATLGAITMVSTSLYEFSTSGCRKWIFAIGKYNGKKRVFVRIERLGNKRGFFGTKKKNTVYAVVKGISKKCGHKRNLIYKPKNAGQAYQRTRIAFYLKGMRSGVVSQNEKKSQWWKPNQWFNAPVSDRYIYLYNYQNRFATKSDGWESTERSLFSRKPEKVQYLDSDINNVAEHILVRLYEYRRTNQYTDKLILNWNTPEADAKTSIIRFTASDIMTNYKPIANKNVTDIVGRPEGKLKIVMTQSTCGVFAANINENGVVDTWLDGKWAASLTANGLSPGMKLSGEYDEDKNIETLIKKDNVKGWLMSKSARTFEPMILLFTYPKAKATAPKSRRKTKRTISSHIFTHSERRKIEYTTINEKLDTFYDDFAILDLSERQDESTHLQCTSNFTAENFENLSN